MGEIVLYGGKICLVDDDVFNIINSHKWHEMTINDRISYAQGRPLSSKRKYLMHRYILELKGLWKIDDYSKDIHHKNGNGLDNRAENLEVISHALNIRLGNWPIGKSGHKGIYWMKANNKWRAHCSLKRKFIHIGLFDTIEQAIEARQTYLNTHNTSSL